MVLHCAPGGWDEDGGNRHKGNVMLKVLRGLETVKRWHVFNTSPGTS